jgi:hypothetical protein
VINDVAYNLTGEVFIATSKLIFQGTATANDDLSKVYVYPIRPEYTELLSCWIVK